MVEWPGPPLPEDAHQDHALYWRNVKGGLFEEDFFWREHQRWLADAGYMLRPRYRDDWQPSWLESGKATYQCEDGKSILVSDNILMLLIPTDHILLQRGTILDATRMSDDRIVTIKRVKKSNNPWEESIIRLFSTEPLASDLHNYSVPLLDVLQSPLDENSTLLVMPYLVRFHLYKFTSVGEALECFRQVFAAS